MHLHDNHVKTHFVIGEAVCMHACECVRVCMRVCHIKPHTPFPQSSDTCFHLCLPHLSPLPRHTIKVGYYTDMTYYCYNLADVKCII